MNFNKHIVFWRREDQTGVESYIITNAQALIKTHVIVEDVMLILGCDSDQASGQIVAGILRFIPCPFSVIENMQTLLNYYQIN